MSSDAHTTESESSSAPQLIRITRSGKIKTWVTFALEFLEKHENRPIVLHTLPASPNATKTNSEGADEVEQQEGEGRDRDKTSSSSSSTATATSLTTIPRLISVVEIIKREFLKTLEKNSSTRLTGLHQYNEIGCLEDLGLVHAGSADVPDEEKRQAAIAMALEGKNFPKRKQNPYMKITLSHCELPELVKAGATYQPPLVRKISRSAKNRVKKRQKKAALAAEGKEAAQAAA